MTFTVNVLFTCIIYCDAGPGYDFYSFFQEVIIYIVHVEWFELNVDGETNRENIVLIHYLLKWLEKPGYEQKT